MMETIPATIPAAMDLLRAAFLRRMDGLTPGWCDGYAFHFSVFVDEWHTKDFVRGMLRQMTDEGLCYYMRGLFTEEGQVAGAGYGITQKGRDWLKVYGSEA